jgi:formylglycine-generating enzyme required for sulfatase activity
MGSPSRETGRFDSEGPRHRVAVGYALAVGKYDITRGEYAAFVEATGYRPNDAGCFTINASGAAVGQNAGAHWRRPGFDQTARDPVVCINFDDAGAYVAWLSRKTGHAYRLLSEAEYEYAERRCDVRLRLRQRGRPGRQGESGLEGEISGSDGE